MSCRSLFSSSGSALNTVNTVSESDVFEVGKVIDQHAQSLFKIAYGVLQVRNWFVLLGYQKDIDAALEKFLHGEVFFEKLEKSRFLDQVTMSDNHMSIVYLKTFIIAARRKMRLAVNGGLHFPLLVHKVQFDEALGKKV